MQRPDATSRSKSTPLLEPIIIDGTLENAFGYQLPSSVEKRSGRREPHEDANICIVNHKFEIEVLPYWKTLLKRMLDICGATVAIILFSPIFVLTAIFIKLDSRGPVFFTQPRVGKGGRIFKLYKFRTMIVDSEKLKQQLLDKNEATGPVFKMKNDPRVTKIGSILRRYSIDELPQLFNVLKNEMSLVGPRPPLPDEVKQYKHWQTKRLSTAVGITCIWQVSGRSNVSFEDWMRMDIRYIKSWSLLLDLKLLLLTVGAVVLKKGAY